MWFAIFANMKYNVNNYFKRRTSLKKLFVLLALLLCAILFVGCATVSLEYKIDNDNTLLVNYTVTIDKTKEESVQINYFNIKNAIEKQWKLQGLEVTIDESDEAIIFNGVLTEQHSTRKKAFERLDEIFKSDYSPFVNVGFEYASSYFEDEYKLSAELSLVDLIRRSDTQVVPNDMQQLLTKYANESEYYISISLPGEAVDTNADSKESRNDVTTNTWNLKYGDEKEITLNSIIVNQENVEYHENLTATNNRLRLILLLCAGGAALVLVVFLIVFFALRRRG